jgi:hypothetical protein
MLASSGQEWLGEAIFRMIEIQMAPPAAAKES